MIPSRLSAAAVLLLCGAAAPAQELPTFATGVEVIRVDVLVTDRGRPVPDLTAEAFEVRDGGVLQQVALVGAEEVPLNLILVLDASASVAGAPIEDLRSAAGALLRRLEAGDQAALVTFSAQATVREPLTGDVGRVERALGRVQPAGETAVIDASYAALLLAEGELDRDLVIVFSDGVDTSSWLTAPQVLEAARHADVVVYAVTLKGMERPKLLEDLSELTGGSLLEVSSTRELDAAFLGILEEFRHRYLLSYTPRGVPRRGWHDLSVRVKGRRARVQARAGYTAGPEPGDGVAGVEAVRGAEPPPPPPAPPPDAPAGGSARVDPAPHEPLREPGGAPARSDSQVAFPVGIDQVVVDAVVTDGDGQPLTDLAAADFEIYEDGVRQTPTSFELVERAEAPAAGRKPASGSWVSTNAEAADVSGRTFAVVFDDVHLSAHTAAEARDAIAAFVTAETRGGDRVTLIAPGSGLWWNARLPEDRADLLEVVRGLRGLFAPDLGPDRLSDEEARRIHLYGDEAAIRAVERRYASRGVSGSAQLIRAKADAVYPAIAARSEVVLAAMERALEALAQRRGRKSMILVSEGFVHDARLSGLDRTLTASLRANTPIYFLSARGLRAALRSDEDARMDTPEGSLTDGEFPWPAGPGAGPAPRARDDEPVGPLDPGVLTRESETAGGAAMLARDTGGFSMRDTEQLRVGMKRIADETRAYYLIGYRPTNPARDGGYREIAVRVPGRKGVRVRARRGYYALPDVAGASGDTPARDRGLQRAMDSPYALRGIGLRMTHFVGEPTSPGRARVSIAAEVDARDLALEALGTDAIGALRFVMVAIDRAGAEPLRRDERLLLRLAPEIRQDLARLWLPIVREFELGAGSYRCKIVVEDEGSGRVGSLVHDFVVPELGPDRLRLSTPVLSDVWAPNPDGSSDARVALTARRVFAPDATVYCRIEVYGARLPASGLPDVTLSYEVRRSDGALHARASPRALEPAPGDTLSGTVAFSLDGAAQGDYEIELNVRDTLSGETRQLRRGFSIRAAPR